MKYCYENKKSRALKAFILIRKLDKIFKTLLRFKNILIFDWQSFVMISYDELIYSLYPKDISFYHARLWQIPFRRIPFFSSLKKSFEKNFAGKNSTQSLLDFCNKKLS